MDIQKVGSEYIKGVPAFNNLINMIEAAIQDAGIPYEKGVMPDWYGFYMKNHDLWSGINLSEHLVAIFEIVHMDKFNAKLVEKPSYPVLETHCIYFRMPLNEDFFFLDKDKQFEELKKFIKTAHNEAEQMRIKEE